MDKLEIIISGEQINQLIDKFKVFNMNYRKLFANINQREALIRLILQPHIGYEKLSKAIDMVAQTNGMDYAPDIRTPIELEAKWDKWVAFLWREKNKENKNKFKVML